MKYKEIKDIAFKVLSSYYNINYINSTNLDKHTLLFENDNLKLRVVPHKKYNYLSYSKKDKENITSLLPLSDYMFEKCLSIWFTNNFSVKIDGVLLPWKY